MPSALVQIVRTHWTKRSRGGPAAARRAALPRAFLLERAPGYGELFLDELVLWEPDFSPTRRIRPHTAVGDLPAADGVRLLREGDLLRVQFAFPANGGAPLRSTVDPAGNTVPLVQDVCRLAPDQWARVEWNARTSSIDTGEWSYRLITVNVAFGTEFERDLFASTPPSATCSHLADLW